MKKAFTALFLFAGLITALAFYVQAQQEKKVVEHVHYHAGFQVYVDNVKQDYSDFQYMSLSPCAMEPKELTPEEEQSEKGHLHDQIGDVVHVHRTGGTWQDLFTNIAVSFPKNTEVKVYDANGEVDHFFDTAIVPYQSVVIVVGDQSNVVEYQQSLVTREHIEETEQRSELCGTN